jgi:hypothetical protein
MTAAVAEEKQGHGRYRLLKERKDCRTEGDCKCDWIARRASLGGCNSIALDEASHAKEAAEEGNKG